MKVAYRGQLDAIDQWLRDINNKLTMGISPTFLLNDCQKMQTDLREVAEKIKHEYPFYSQTLPGIGDNLFRPDPFNYGLMALNVAAFGELFIIVQHLVREPVDMRFWQDIHPRIIEVSKELFCDGHFAAASESAIKEVETRMRELFKEGKPNSPTAIQNLLNAIQQGILTKSTKSRLEELEATKEELEIKIACEKLAKPKVSAEFMTFWLQRFRKLDVRQKSHRKMLIDTFINAIFLYDDKMVITFNYKEGTTTITFDDLKTALADQKTGSDLDCSTAPWRVFL